MSQFEDHYVNRSNWIRAAVLGANDGILSVSSIAVGVASATGKVEPIAIASLAGLVAGALSMAAGEYVSVSSQADIEEADIAREAKELQEMPELEERELAKIYVRRGLKPATAAEVARQLHEHDALAAHARDELGINEFTAARPLQAAGASALSFIIGGLFPLLLVFIFHPEDLYWAEYIFSISFLALLGGISAKIGGSSIFKAISRVIIWGTITMGLSALIGTLVQV
jgi:vacuolar iron transporter family protein|tara:strand:- start:2854 stop:3537 length:684 start_codon:yes stop_codon:yes gene_type:complete